MTTEPAAAASTDDHGLTFDEAGRLVSELACIKCRYNLRTQHRDAACPECGTAVGRSIEGNRLRYCDPAWLKQIWEGLNCFGGAVVAAIVCVVVAWQWAFPPLLLAAALPATAMGLAIYGFFKATRPDPARIDRESWFTPRRWARGWWGTALVLIAALLLLVVAFRTLNYASPTLEWTANLMAIAALAALALGPATLLIHAAVLAHRLPNRPLVAAVVLVDVCFVTVGLFGAVLAWEWLWHELSSPQMFGYAARSLRYDLMGWLRYLLLVLAAMMVLLLAWYWWALSRAARHAWATWAQRKGE